MAARHDGVRIIAGRWRRTRIAVADRAGLRPTADRVRETLFNWLGPRLPGAHCLDLCAGSGALGFEAASRGAARAVLVERDRVAVDALRALQRKLAADTVFVHEAEVLSWLDGSPQPFDIVFVDPPFESALTAPTLERLTRGWLAPGACVYLEMPVTHADPEPPWRIEKAGRTQHVKYMLIEYAANHR